MGNEFVKESSETQPTGTTNAEANIKIEYLKKYKITINKKSLFDKSNLKNVGYKLSSSNESNKYGNTDINGNLTFSGLKTNVIYTLTETVAPMHYINPEITFKVTESNGTPSISIIKGTAESINILETREKQNQANISILDEKVKTYTLKVVKYEKGNLNKRLAHAQFLITGDGILNGKVVETDDNGEATITGLYEYKPGQQYKGEYIIEELVPPEGYQGQYKVGLKVQRDAGNIARVMATTTELDIKNAEQDNPTVMLFAANEPLFKIIKKDAKTSELLPNTKFGISKVDDSGNESEALDINNNPVGTLENIGGKQYRTITTNEKGEYSAGLKSGKYKFVELQPSNDKYELPQNEADRTYTVNVGEPAKAKYKFVEDKNLEKIPEVTKSYGETVGLRRTFVNGEVIHYTLKKDKTDKIGNNRILTIYDNEFNVKKEVTFDSGTPYQMPEINIGKDGSIYSYIPKLGIRKYSPDGRFISQVGDYFGFSRYQYNRLKWDMGAFGNSLFDNDTKSVPFQNPVVKNNDASVLLEEAIEGLNIKDDGIYVDCTLGGAGHSLEILKKLTTGKLYAFDQDNVALENAKIKLSEYADKVVFIKSNFENLKEKLAEQNVYEVDGVLYDLGVSSPQLDTPERGFSYNYDTRLDMRMDTDASISAYEVVNEYSYHDLVRIFYRYGEEKFSKQIARNIEKKRELAPIETTFQLVDIIKESIPAAKRRTGGHPAKRVFQAIRIAVNNELSVFENSLEQAIDIVKVGGRISVITFHSLEDRICKQIFNSYAKNKEIPKNLPILPNESLSKLKLITRKPICPSDKELEENNRSRSAKLRVAEVQI